MSQALKCYKHDSKIFNMAMIHIQGTWVWFYPIRECIPSLEYFRFALSRAHAENVFQSVFDVLFHVTAIVCFQLIKSGIQKRQFSQIWFIHRLLNLPLFSKIFHPKKSFPTRLGNKTERNLLNILSITHALLSEFKIFFEEKFVYTTIARRTAAGSLKTQWWRRLSTNQGKE